MVDWKLVLFWVAAVALGAATWWALIAWFGTGSALVALAMLGLAASAGALLDPRPQRCEALTGRVARPPDT